MAGRRKNEGETRQITVSVPLKLFERLTQLAGNSVLGVSPADVASHILKDRIFEWENSGFLK